ncbi:shikimate dehydrogenase, partial [Pseudomonas aeruginosa]|nr:shikimate dehydrogenase [Pseudomonas aeruginosa]
MSAPRSVLAGLIGAGIQASRTPALHEREGDAQGIRYLYRLIDLDPLGKSADDLEFLLAAASDLGFTGLNVTFPCKQAIIPLLDELSAEARGIGAVNTVVLRDGRRIGHNTDCLGFAEGFRRGLADAPRQRVVQMGAGGAGGSGCLGPAQSELVRRTPRCSPAQPGRAALAAAARRDLGLGP